MSVVDLTFSSDEDEDVDIDVPFVQLAIDDDLSIRLVQAEREAEYLRRYRIAEADAVESLYSSLCAKAPPSRFDV